MKRYNVFLEDKMIGTTAFEAADAPMGVIFGKVYFADVIYGYVFFKKYCFENNIGLASDYPKDKLIATRTMKHLRVRNASGTEIEHLGNQISGMDGDVFEITLEGVAYPFFEAEFPHHVNNSPF